MKNWKRFMAACLSVTMLATTPLTTLADNMSTTPVAVSNEKAEPQKTEEFEAILSHKTPYQYFTGLKNQQEIVDGLSNEQLFQLKELMKYAYIHENSKENRQSLEPYMLILKNYEKRKLKYQEDEKNAFIQDALEKSAVYKTAFNNQEVLDLTSYLEYLQSIKNMDIPSYVDMLNALEDADGKKELKKAEKRIAEHEKQIYGGATTEETNSDKTENTHSDKEDAAAQNEPAENEAVEEDRVLTEEPEPYSVNGYTEWISGVTQWKDVVPGQNIVFDKSFTLENVEVLSLPSDYVIGKYNKLGYTDLTAIMYNGPIVKNANYYPGDIKLKWNDIGFDKDKDRIDMEVTFTNNHIKGNPQYDTEKPRLISRRSVNDSYFGTYYLELGDGYCRFATNVHVKFLKRGTNTLANGDFVGYFTDIDAPDFGEIYFTPFSEKVFTGEGISSIYTSNTCTLNVRKYGNEYQLESTKYDDNTLDSGFVLKTKPEFSFQSRIAGASTQILKQFSLGTITATAGPGGSITDEGVTYVPWKNEKEYFITPDRGHHITDVIVDGKPQGPIPSYKFPPIAEDDHTIEAIFAPNVYNVTYDGNGGLYGNASTWSEKVTYGTNYTTWDNFFDRRGYVFKGWNESPDGTGTDWTAWIGKPWTWTYLKDITLYAQWEPLKFNVTYNGNGGLYGEASTWSEKVTYGTNYTTWDNFFDRRGYVFKGWNESPDGKGTDWTEYIGKPWKWTYLKDVTLYAQWFPITYHIQYKGNGATSGMEQTDSVLQETILNNGSYELKDNVSFTNFATEGKKFRGWYMSTTIDDVKNAYAVGTKMTVAMLNDIYKEQVSQNLVEQNDLERNILLYAVWDKAPEITFSDSFKDQFYEGTTVTRQDLLNGVTAQDDIDADIANKVVITQIEYAAGKLSETGKEDAYTQKWIDGMPEDAVLDTWFMKLDKNDAPVKHKVTYQVTDSAGNVTTVTKEVKVLYNEFPEIVANNQRFTLEKAQAGEITEDALLKDLIASGELSASDTEEGDLSSKLELVDFDPTLFTTMKREGFIPITYRVHDTMGPDGNGKETLKRVNVDITAVRPDEYVKYVRFINKEYYYKNANLDLNSMTKQEIALKAVNGGLHPKSKWYTDPEYREFITKALDNNTPRESYQYTKEDIQKMREFVKEHGIGNAKEEDALDKFAEIFMTGHYKIK